MSKLSWTEHVSLVKPRSSEAGATRERQLVAEGNLFTICLLILGLTPDQRVGFAIHFPERRIDPLEHGTSEFSLMISNAKAENERRRDHLPPVPRAIAHD